MLPDLNRHSSRLQKVRILLIAVLAFVVTSVSVRVGQVVAQGVLPEQAAARMQVADGLTVRLTASEPLVRQPVCIEFDDRGRLWVIQYLQYPNPADLKRVEVDRFSRTRYDRIPEPPPHGPRGADRITILTDTDQDGVMDTAQDFVSGLNLATGMAFGHGGVYVLNVPYLLFYPDVDGNDIPDGDPQVLLTGFGMEDAHSVANSLTWGPDGWLYGCQGSTVTASIRGIEFQQGVWRYHPRTQEFELFCEGGGNSWGLDFDRTGRLFYSTNYGGHVLLHGLQGAWFVKAFAKHGALHNPFSYGYFDHAPHHNFRGGHVTVGGIIYQADGLPAAFRDKYIGGDLLGHAVYWHHVLPDGSTVRTAHGGELLQSNDLWFAPTDITTGPDGAIYVSDWHDARTAHPDPDAEWDRSNGRIFRIAARDTSAVEVMDPARLSSAELLQQLDHPNQWYVRRARKHLVQRADPELVSVLADRALSDNSEVRALESLWTLYQMTGLDDTLCSDLLQSPHAAIRSWTVRLLGDRRQVSMELAEQLDHLAEHETSVEVRQHLACAAARLPAHQAMPIINANINRDIDHTDSRLPMLWWWAVERHAISGREEVMRRFVRPTLWKSRLGRENLLPRLVRRYMAEGTSDGFDAVFVLLRSIPENHNRDSLWPSLLQGYRDQTADDPVAVRRKRLASHALGSEIFARWQTSPDDLTLTNLCLLTGREAALENALAEIRSSANPPARRAALLEMLAEHSGVSEHNPALLKTEVLELISAELPENVQLAAIQVLAGFDDPDVSSRLIALCPEVRSETVRDQVHRILLSRPRSAMQLLREVEAGRIPAAEIPLDQIRRIALLNDAELNVVVRRHWGQLQAATREEKLAEVRRLNNDLRAASGNSAAGQLVFRKHCSTCHQFLGEGKALGPDLTTANRADREFLLISLVDPGSVIRKEYMSYVVQLRDGRLVSGMAVARDDAGITLVSEKHQMTRIDASEIAELRESDVSLMPENLYRQLSPQELRDLFAYLQTPVPGR